MLKRWKFKFGMWIAAGELEQRVFAYESAAQEAATRNNFADAHALTSMATALVELARW